MVNYAPISGTGNTGNLDVPQYEIQPLTGGVSATGATGGASGGQSQVIDVSPTTTETYSPTDTQTYTPTYSPTTTVSAPTTNTVNQSYTQNNNNANQSTVLAAAMGAASPLSPAQTSVPVSTLNPLTLQGAAQAKYTPYTYTPPASSLTALPSALNPNTANPYLRTAAPVSGSLQGYSGPPQSGYAINNSAVPGVQPTPFAQMTPQQRQATNYDGPITPQQAAAYDAQNGAAQAPAQAPAPPVAAAPAQQAAATQGVLPQYSGDMPATPPPYDPYTAKFDDPIPAGAVVPPSEIKRMMFDAQDAARKNPGTTTGAAPSNPNKPSTFAALPWYAKLGMAMSPRAQAAFSARQKLNNDWVKDFAMKSYEAGLQEHKLEKEQGMIGDREKALQEQKHQDKIAEDKAKDGTLNANQKREALQWHLEHTDPGSDARRDAWQQGILSYAETQLPRTSGSTLTEDNQRATLQGKQYENNVAGSTMVPQIQSAFANANKAQNEASISNQTMPGVIAGTNARNAEAITNAQTAQATQGSDIASKAYGAIKQYQDAMYAPAEEQRKAVGSLANMLKVTTDAAFMETDPIKKQQYQGIASQIMNLAQQPPQAPQKGQPGYVPQRGEQGYNPKQAPWQPPPAPLGQAALAGYANAAQATNQGPTAPPGAYVPPPPPGTGAPMAPMTYPAAYSPPGMPQGAGSGQALVPPPNPMQQGAVQQQFQMPMPPTGVQQGVPPAPYTPTMQAPQAPQGQPMAQAPRVAPQAPAMTPRQAFAQVNPGAAQTAQQKPNPEWEEVRRQAQAVHAMINDASRKEHAAAMVEVERRQNAIAKNLASYYWTAESRGLPKGAPLTDPEVISHYATLAGTNDMYKRALQAGGWSIDHTSHSTYRENAKPQPLTAEAHNRYANEQAQTPMGKIQQWLVPPHAVVNDAPRPSAPRQLPPWQTPAQTVQGRALQHTRENMAAAIWAGSLGSDKHATFLPHDDGMKAAGYFYRGQ